MPQIISHPAVTANASGIVGGVAYQSFGSAGLPVLLFGNSLATDTRLWTEQVAALQSRYRIIVFDYPGHGSPLWPDASAIRQFAEKLALLLDALGIETYSYCGLSMGGALGMELALLHPARMQKLILSNTAAQFGSADFWNRRSATASEQGMAALADATIARWFTAEAALAHPLNFALARDMFLSTNADGYAQCCAVVRDFDFTAQLPQIRVPTLVIAGTNDMACTAEQARVLADSIPGARYSELPVAHLGNLGAGAEFTSALFSFLTSL